MRARAYIWSLQGTFQPSSDIPQEILAPCILQQNVPTVLEGGAFDKCRDSTRLQLWLLQRRFHLKTCTSEHKSFRPCSSWNSSQSHTSGCSRYEVLDTPVPLLIVPITLYLGSVQARRLEGDTWTRLAIHFMDEGAFASDDKVMKPECAETHQMTDEFGAV